MVVLKDMMMFHSNSFKMLQSIIHLHRFRWEWSLRRALGPRKQPFLLVTRWNFLKLKWSSKVRRADILTVQWITNCSNYTGNTGTEKNLFWYQFSLFLLILLSPSYSDMQNKIFKLCYLILNTLFAWFTNPFCS